MFSLFPTKRKIFVSYHHANDQSYYDTFSKYFAETFSLVYDNSLDRIVDSDDCEYVMRRIRENYISGTSCTLVLCGPETRWRKYVDWEIKATLDKQHGLIGVLLPNNPPLQPPVGQGAHKPDRLQDNIDSGYAVLTTWNELIAYPAGLPNLIQEANQRSKTLIKNGRAMRQRNGNTPLPAFGRQALLSFEPFR